MEIRKIVIPAAGLGTRFLPQTKAMPKEMLPVVDKPVIQYVVEEAVASGIEDVIIITGWQKRAIEDHFDRSPELEKYLAEKGKEKELSEIKRIAELANFIYIRQKGMLYGNAIPVLTAQPVIGEEPFAIMWGDEFILAEPPRLAQMIEVYKKYQGAVISGVRIETKDHLTRYGIADLEPVEDPSTRLRASNVFKVKKIVEKPIPDEAPSNLATHGAYILPSEIFEIIKNLKPGRDDEIWLVDAINELIKKGFPVYACEIKNGTYYDTGSKIGWLRANVDFALKDKTLGKDFKHYLKSVIK